ncbi:MAG: hypothetical protein ACJAU2_001866 [Maribacter sp.]|jgi:uncharacterized protein (DUF2141 family)
MKLKNSLMIIAMLTFGASAAQHTLRLTITGVGSSQGKISAALYTDQKTFLKFDAVFKAVSEKAEKGVTNLVVKDIPDGDYAVAVFHDKNENGKLDTNMLGIPKEPVAFSNAKMKMFGPPKFDECAFSITKDIQVSITLN